MKPWVRNIAASLIRLSCSAGSSSALQAAIL
jgi:hypothetical protein